MRLDLRTSALPLILYAMLATNTSCASPNAHTIPDRPAERRVTLANENPSKVAAPIDGWASTLNVNHPLVGRIWSPSMSTYVDRGTVVERIGRTRFVLLGETHDNADHHRLQAEMIRAVAATGRKPSVVFEMIDRRLQENVDEQLSNAPTEVDTFGEAIAWADSGWPEWAIYRPVFVEVLNNRLPVIAAQFPREEAMEVARGGSLSEDLVRQYRLDTPLPQPLNKALLDQLVESHCGHMPATMMQPMVEVQRARDAIMADKLLSTATSDGAVLIAGGGHVRADRGVPWYMGLTANEVVTIGFMQVMDDADEPRDYAAYYDGSLPFDYIWFTPRDNDIDHCKELEQHMKKAKHGKGEEKGGEKTGSDAQNEEGGNDF